MNRINGDTLKEMLMLKEWQKSFRKSRRLPLFSNLQDVRLYHNRFLPPFTPESWAENYKAKYTKQSKIIEMSEQNDNRVKWLHLRLKEEEYSRIHKNFSKTTCRKLSDYSRKILLGKPLVATYRNQSLDDFMAEMMLLRSELNSIGKNFNQAVRKLHSLTQIAEFRVWLMTYELEKEIVLNKIEEIKNRINKIADQWLQ